MSPRRKASCCLASYSASGWAPCGDRWLLDGCLLLSPSATQVRVARISGTSHLLFHWLTLLCLFCHFDLSSNVTLWVRGPQTCFLIMLLVPMSLSQHQTSVSFFMAFVPTWNDLCNYVVLFTVLSLEYKLLEHRILKEENKTRTYMVARAEFVVVAQEWLIFENHGAPDFALSPFGVLADFSFLEHILNIILWFDKKKFWPKKNHSVTYH